MIRGDLSDRLIHLTSSGSVSTGAVAQVIEDRAAITRFLSIVRSQRLIAGNRNIRGGYKCVCFSEAPIAVLAQMTADRNSRYAPLGVMVDKRWLFSHGGRPVIYQPESENETLPESLRYRHVRYDPERSIDFTWEREWRLHADQLVLDPAATTLVVPSRALVDHFKEEHLQSQKQKAFDYGEDTAFVLESFPWHFLVLEDLGVEVDFG